MYVTVRAGMRSEQHRVRQQSLPEGPAKSARPETAQCEEGNVCLPDLHPLFFFAAGVCVSGRVYGHCAFFSVALQSFPSSTLYLSGCSE